MSLAITRRRQVGCSGGSGSGGVSSKVWDNGHGKEAVSGKGKPDNDGGGGGIHKGGGNGHNKEAGGGGAMRTSILKNWWNTFEGLGLEKGCVAGSGWLVLGWAGTGLHGCFASGGEGCKSISSQADRLKSHLKTTLQVLDFPCSKNHTKISTPKLTCLPSAAFSQLLPKSSPKIPKTKKLIFPKDR